MGANRLAISAADVGVNRLAISADADVGTNRLAINADDAGANRPASGAATARTSTMSTTESLWAAMSCAARL